MKVYIFLYTWFIKDYFSQLVGLFGLTIKFFFRLHKYCWMMQAGFYERFMLAINSFLIDGSMIYIHLYLL